MSLLFFDGFEMGVSSQGKPEWVTAPSISGNSPRSGVISALFASTAFGVLSFAASAKVTFGCAVMSQINRSIHFGILADARAVTHLTVTVGIDGAVTIRRGTSAGTVLAATAAGVFPMNEYRHLQIQATIHDTTGTCIVRLDNVEILNFTGDTKNAGTSTNIDGLNFSSSGTAQTNVCYDDLWVVDGVDDTATTGRTDNGFLGDLKVQTLYPTADGASSQFVGSDGNSVNNYLLVDESNTANTSDYVASSTPGNRDLYNITDLDPTTTTVYSVRVTGYVSKSDAGAAGIKLIIRESDGTVTSEANYTLSTTWTHIHGLQRKTKPAGGAWSPANINALQMGVEALAS
jgi:hypothetical protein